MCVCACELCGVCIQCILLLQPIFLTVYLIFDQASPGCYVCGVVCVCVGGRGVHCYTEFYRWFALFLSCSPLSDGAPEGDDAGDDEGIMSITGDHRRLYGVRSEMELIPPPRTEELRDYSVLGVMDQDNYTNSPARLHGGLCSEAV